MSQKKQIFKISVLKKLLADENSCVSLVQSTRLLALPPFFLNDMKSGIFYQLNSLLKKYDRSLGGIVIGYQNIKVLMDENTGIIPMGAPETEVNTTVEFYIFQPKIGSYLEGIVNKKSNTHVGCLVHQYFNATILKPEDVYYEDWICKDLNVDDKIIFKVKDLDFTTLLPYIEGIYDGNILLGKTQTNSNRNCDTDNPIAVDNSHFNEVSDLSEFSGHETTVYEEENDCISSKQNNNLNEEEVKMSDANKSIESEENESYEKTKKKKKKKNKEKVELSALSNNNFDFKESSLNDKEVISDRSDKNLLINETPEKKKKKKKKKDDPHESVVENEKKELPNNPPLNIYNKLIEVVDEDSNDFIKTIKSKKDGKKKKTPSEISPDCNKIRENLPPEDMDDNVLYSTQLDPTVAEAQMRISFCSPIPQTNNSEVKGIYKNTTTDALPHQVNKESLSEKEVKKKNKKRKREKQEEESGDSPATKKTKTSNTSFSSSNVEDTESKVNGGEENSVFKSVVEELFKQQLNRVREELNKSSSDKESVKDERKKSRSKKEKKADRSESLNVSNAMTSQMNEEKNSESKNLVETLLNEELQKVKEELSTSDKDSIKGSKKSRHKTKKKKRFSAKERKKEDSFKNRETTNAQINGTKDSEKVSDSENSIKQKLNIEKEEVNKLESDRGKEKKKRKSVTNKHEVSRGKNENSLYEKLLNEARSAIVVEQHNATNILDTREPTEEKKDEPLNLTGSSSKKKDSKKKSKEKKHKLEDCHQPTDNFKNGSMYDVAPTPEKRNPDKSLFSDSEQSHLSPVKKPKEVNDKPGKYMIQSLIDDFYKGEREKKLKSEPNKDSLKSTEKKSKKQKKMEKSETQNVKLESLYEKLLNDAKNSVCFREESPSRKKEKKSSEGKSKQKTVQDCAKN